MIVEWFNSVFTLLGVSMPSNVKIFGVGISYNDLILCVFLSLFVFFIIEITIGIKHLINKERSF